MKQYSPFRKLYHTRSSWTA